MSSHFMHHTTSPDSKVLYPNKIEDMTLARWRQALPNSRALQSITKQASLVMEMVPKQLRPVTPEQMRMILGSKTLQDFIDELDGLPAYFRPAGRLEPQAALAVARVLSRAIPHVWSQPHSSAETVVQEYLNDVTDGCRQDSALKQLRIIRLAVIKPRRGSTAKRG